MERIVVLDFGSQYTQLIARRLRELNIYSEIEHYSYLPDDEDTVGIILSGGPRSIYDEDAPKPDPRIFELGKPILGICYGLQVIAEHFGGKVLPSPREEYGRSSMEVILHDELFKGLPSRFSVWMSHADRIESLPEGFVSLSRSEGSPYCAIANMELKIYGVQFHPEVSHTEFGETILRNFAYNVCKAKGTWNMESFLENTIQDVKETVKDGKVVLALSGGVDSSVLAKLLEIAIPDQVFPIFVDTGLLKLGEKERISKLFSDNPNLRIVDAQELFISGLKGITDPEEKRKVVGKLFVEVFQREAEKVGASFLAQGTLYPDVIESQPVVGPSHRIKTHHNVGGLPRNLDLKLVEPFRYLFKDEVRKLGKLLGLPKEVIYRHPFPGPGFAVRILGEVDKHKLDIVKQADRILEEELIKHGIYYDVWQAFPVLIPVRTVGVMGDRRTYEYTIAIRIVQSEDGMTANFYRANYDFLESVASRIVGEVKGINRIVYDITSKPPSTIEWE